MVQDDSFFLEVTPKSEDELFKIAERLDEWVFRGQANVSWHLTTSLERAAQRLGCPLDELAAREALMLRGFKRRAHLYCPHCPRDDSSVEWLAMMQHYGCPTRFIDFTRSLFTALFFAVEGATTDAAVWAVNTVVLQKRLRKQLPNVNQYDRAEPLDRNEIHIQHVSKLIGKSHTYPTVIDVEPERLNERMVAQQGLFLVPFKLDLSFHDNLSKMFELPNEVWKSAKRQEKIDSVDVRAITVVKIVVLRALVPGVIRRLENANTTAMTLFPGLDGFARSFQFQLMPRSLSKVSRGVS